MRVMPFNKSTIEGVEITLEKGDCFLGVFFRGCIIDDVSNAPFKNHIFNSCCFENTRFKSELEAKGCCSIMLHRHSFIE